VNDAPTDLLGNNFMGRLKDLDFLSQVFRTQNIATEEDVPTRCVVYGMPGLGKTKLVLRFAQIVFARLLYTHVFWMSASTTNNLIEGMAKILELVRHPERTRAEQYAKLIAARLWLEDSQRTDGIRWLLVVDNVDRSALEFLHENLPRRNMKGSILFTTRASDVANALVRVPGGCHSTLDLRVPDLVETTDLFFSSAAIDASTLTPTQKNQASELIRNLGCLPLAVVQAASYMRQTAVALENMLEISTCERKIEVCPMPRCNLAIDDDHQMVEWESDLATDQQRSLVATFDTLLDQLERDFPKAYDVLRILSFLDPENMPLEMLKNAARIATSRLDQLLPGDSQRESRMSTPSPHRSRNDSSSLSHQLLELASLVSVILSPTAFPKALHKLQSISLVEFLSRDGESSLRMHDLVHFITREHVRRQTTYQAWLESTVSLICSLLKRVEDPHLPESWPECEKIMPHVRSLSKVWTGVEGVNLELADADVRLARYLNSRGRYDDAERLCERSLGIYRKELGEKHKSTLEAIYYLAQIYTNQGRFTDAEEAYKRVLAVLKKEFGVDHEETLDTMHGLATVYFRQGRNKEAEELHKRILAVREKKLGPDHRSTLTTMSNLAAVYDSQTRYDEAAELYKHVLAHWEKTLGRDHIETLTTTHNLASVYLAQRNYSDAAELFKRALVGREKLLGPSHPDTLIAVVYLAVLYQSQARNDEAERFYLRAFTGMKQHLGTNHPDTLDCAKRLANFYRSLKRNVEADALFGQ
jgi:tetratricopeptide (TPR) repeat protein